METIETIETFVGGSGNGEGYGSSNDYGDGSGDSWGSGYGNGRGSGYSSGSGYGDGSGWGDGSGSGDGEGSGDGSGYGDGSGSSYGCGFGGGDADGCGNGYGNGSGSGFGHGNSYGVGDVYGLKSINSLKIHKIDNVQTILYSVRGNVARGAIVNSDLTLFPCYVMKHNKVFAHGKTIKEASNSLQNKIFNDLSVEKRIDGFRQNFPDFKKKVNASILSEWHGKLTGSCKLGRESFCKNHSINVNSKYTIMEFIQLTKDAYGGEIIKRLKN